MEISKNKALYTGTFEDNLKKTFIPGERYTFRSIKSILQEISEQLGMNMSFKATDLGDYFNIKPIKMTIDGRREHGYEILGIR
jgi:phenylalanyl-tRNA synthetase beta subunit